MLVPVTLEQRHAAAPTAVCRRAWLPAATVASLSVLLLTGSAAVLDWIDFIERPPVRLGERAIRGTPAATRPRDIATAATPTTMYCGTGSVDEPELPWPPQILSAAAGGSHDPFELLGRANRLSLAGADITVIRTRLPRRATPLLTVSPESVMRSAQTAPVFRKGRLIGVRFDEVDPDSTLSLAGVRNQDVVTAINGYSLGDGDGSHTQHTRAAAPARIAVVEIIRGASRVVLGVTWPEHDAITGAL
jgi:hypothetical protein